MSWNHLEDSRPKARKVYSCHLCERPIPMGEVHVKRTGVTSDGLFTGRMHVACEDKTRGWREDEWESHDASEFRRYELGLEVS